MLIKLRFFLIFVNLRQACQVVKKKKHYSFYVKV